MLAVDLHVSVRLMHTVYELLNRNASLPAYPLKLKGIRHKYLAGARLRHVVKGGNHEYRKT